MVNKETINELCETAKVIQALPCSLLLIHLLPHTITD